MKLPRAKPLEENYLCQTKEDFKELLSKALGMGNGGVFKLLGKVGGVPYYITILVDEQKILAVEAEEVKSGRKLIGDDALGYISKIFNGPVIADAYPLDDIGVKMSVVDNIEAYNRTQRIKLSEFFGDVQITRARNAPLNAEATAPQKPSTMEELYSNVTKDVEKALQERTKKAKKSPPQKLELKLNVPVELDPYFRGFVKKLNAYGKSLGLNLRKVSVEAKEIRYALGSGVGVNAYLTIEAESGSMLPAKRLEEMLREQAYREAGELSSELKKRVVVSDLKLRLI
ncbi:hypothetical protein [Thermococcus sp.]|uniref:hypothetical protein n=1 Tax=Thermococcus sp. TaxID=35749 RepID=UPI002628F516|nr:hypothetical protein [Thermococcus sp.]